MPRVVDFSDEDLENSCIYKDFTLIYSIEKNFNSLGGFNFTYVLQAYDNDGILVMYKRGANLSRITSMVESYLDRIEGTPVEKIKKDELIEFLKEK